ncbi:MAG TPA: hypothetical protein VGL72_09285 [Bryobacteraceae bacterium]|jgi:hypothetical protein
MPPFSPDATTHPDEDRRDRRATRRIAYLDAITRLVGACQPTLRLGLVLAASVDLSHLARI